MNHNNLHNFCHNSPINGGVSNCYFYSTTPNLSSRVVEIIDVLDILKRIIKFTPKTSKKLKYSWVLDFLKLTNVCITLCFFSKKPMIPHWTLAGSLESNPHGNAAQLNWLKYFLLGYIDMCKIVCITNFTLSFNLCGHVKN